MRVEDLARCVKCKDRCQRPVEARPDGNASFLERFARRASRAGCPHPTAAGRPLAPCRGTRVGSRELSVRIGDHQRDRLVVRRNVGASVPAFIGWTD